MSSQSWIRRNSPSSTKNGPLKATLPMSSVTRKNSNLSNSQDNSPVTLSPTSPWKTRASPDQILSGIRSPGALNYKGKCHIGRQSSSNIRRTASLDTIYLTGQWPRDLHSSLLHIDKATQTEELDGRKSQRYTPDISVTTEDKLDKIIRHRLLQRSSICSHGDSLQPHLMIIQRPIPTQEHSSQTSSCTPPPLVPPTLPIAAVRSRPPPTMRSSTEGLNQEIERLVLRAMSSLGDAGEEEKAIQITPEGHRAPLPDLLRLTRSVNTQTPCDTTSDSRDVSRDSPPRDTVATVVSRDTNLSPGSGSTSSLGDDSPCVVALLSPARLVASGRDMMSPCPVARHGRDTADSDDRSPTEVGGEEERRDGDSSPKINRFLAREPPDGCERVSLKFTEDISSKDLRLIDYCDLKPSAAFQLRPSAGSAFLPLSSSSSSTSTTTQPPKQSSSPSEASSTTTTATATADS